MHIISLEMLRDFWYKHPEAEHALRNWHTVAEHSRFVDFADLRRSFGSATLAGKLAKYFNVSPAVFVPA